MRIQPSSFVWLRRLLAGSLAAAVLAPATSLAGDDAFPDSFSECRQMGGEIESNGDHRTCTYGVSGEPGDEGVEECSENNATLTACFGGKSGNKTAKSCEETFRETIDDRTESSMSNSNAGGLSATLPPGTTRRRLDHLYDVFEKDDRWDRDEVVRLISGKSSLRKELAQRLTSDDRETHRRAFPVARHLVDEIGPHVWVVDGIERISQNDVDNVSSDLRAAALRVMYALHLDHPDETWMSPGEIREHARQLTEADDASARQVATSLIEKISSE